MHKNKVTNCSLLRHLSLLHRKRTQIYAAHFRFLLTPLSPQTQVYKTRHYTLISLLRPVSLGNNPYFFKQQLWCSWSPFSFNSQTLKDHYIKCPREPPVHSNLLSPTQENKPTQHLLWTHTSKSAVLAPLTGKLTQSSTAPHPWADCRGSLSSSGDTGLSPTIQCQAEVSFTWQDPLSAATIHSSSTEYQPATSTSPQMLLILMLSLVVAPGHHPPPHPPLLLEVE